MSDAICSWPGCDNLELVARGLCQRDYVRVKRAGRLAEFKAPRRLCVVCGASFDVTKHRRSCCSERCTDARRGVMFKMRRLAALPDRECDFCLEPVPTSLRRDARYCSLYCQQAKWYSANAETLRARTSEWNRRHEGKRRAYRHTRRARMYAVAYETFDAWEIADRDGWRCHLCGGQVDRALAYPDPASKSVDHVIPLSKGGSHTRANVAITHLICNTRKKDRMSASFKEVTSPSAVAT